MDNICTVILLTYNHAKYIRQALDSILGQKTKYGFVIHVFDDASMDGTSDIVREYAQKYPDKVIAFIAEKNQGAQTNVWNAYKSVKTKYAAYLDGDDYWCDKDKLEVQINALEDNPDCSICVGNTKVVCIDEKIFKEEHGRLWVSNPDLVKLKEKKLTLKDIYAYKTGFIPHINARLFRMSVIDYNEIKHRETLCYDVSNFLYFITKGNVYFINKVMAIYNRTGQGIATGLSMHERQQHIIERLGEFNLDTNFVIWPKVAQQISFILGVFIHKYNMQFPENKVVENNNTVIKYITDGNKKISLKHYLFPPVLHDIFNLPRNIGRFFKNRHKKVNIANLQGGGVEIEIFSYCNRQCWFCPNSYIDRHSKNIYMKENLYLSILKSLKSINFTGEIYYSRYNEPFSDKIILKRIRQAREYLPAVKLHSNTNGDFLDAEYLREIRDAGLNSLAVQCYLGENEVFDIDKIKERIRKIAERLDIQVKETKVKDDWYEVESQLDTLKIRIYSRDFHKNGTNRAGAINTVSAVARKTPCYIPFKFLYVDYNGKVMPCCNFRSDIKAHKRFILGDLNKKDLIKIYQGRKADSIRKELQKSPVEIYPCNGCNFMTAYRPKIVE